jgi:formylglycine-generating enzyme required for sulfatase activity
VAPAIAEAAADAGLPAPCPAAPPLAVRVAAADVSLCVDTTEVTIDQYTQFLAAKAGDTSGQRDDCTWNTSYVPWSWPSTSPGDHPVTGVDQCDAVAYCAWAGKRLCGAIDGGVLGTGDVGNARASQWYFACSHNDDGLHAFPYGNTYDAAACRGNSPDAGTVAAGSLPGCTGGFPGLMDMSGNVWEWDDACDGPEAGSYCIVRGGSFGETPDQLQCASAVWLYVGRGAGYGDIGFRCCAP